MEELNTLKEKIEDNLKTYLKVGTHSSLIKEAYHYGVLPPGKAFRPLLALSAYEQFHGNLTEALESTKTALSLCSSAVEIHHAYTLVHDDLPAMDDDDMRRGKPSLHKAYGQWQAILVGDGLLNLSYELIGKIDSPLSYQMRSVFSWALGPKGLIEGQTLDLSQEMAKSFQNLLRTHELKTARLIQTSLVLGFLSGAKAWDKDTKKNAYELFKFGRSLGVAFQLLDDLCELSEPLGAHEKDVNPWLHHYEQTFSQTIKELSYLKEKMNEFQAIKLVIDEYFQKIKRILDDGETSIATHLKRDDALVPVMALFN